MSNQTDPYQQFKLWWSEHLATSKDTPMCLSTCDINSNQPSSRMVLLKEVSKEGFIFYTNYKSRKAIELESNPKCSLLFYWNDKQVRVEGTVKKLSYEKSKEYFDSRPLDSRCASIASKQSQILINKEEFLADIEKVKQSGKVDCKDVWGGFCVEPHRIEFWSNGEFRVHERVVYELKEGDKWQTFNLYP